MSDAQVADFPAKLQFLFEPARYKVLYGGRGGTKSWGIARALLILAAQRRMRILCARELQNSIADSVHKLLTEQIEALGLSSIYQVLQASVKGLNGSEFIFTGLRGSAAHIKSLEGVDIAWVEEAQAVSSDSWSTLIPTIRKASSEIWISFNPDLSTDPVYQRFVANPPPGAKVVKVGWEDNPWLPQVLKEEKDYLYHVDPEAAAHVWGGETRRNSAASVLRGRYHIEAFTPQPDVWFGPYYGADFGFAVDPTTLIRCWVHGRTLYIEHEAYGVGVDIEDTPELFKKVPEAEKHVIRADNSRPETISHMRRHGFFRMVGAVKGKASVEEGVEHLRSYERIVIHPRCPKTAEEARLWSYKVDKLSGDVLPVLVDKHDHCWDAIRYALEPVVRAGKPRRVLKVKPKDEGHDYDRREPVADRWKVV